MKVRLGILLFICFLSIQCRTQHFLQLPEIYSDYMVLQRDMPLNIQGRAKPRKNISLRIADKNYRGKSDNQGRWSITVDPLQTGKSYTLEVESAGEKLLFRNILAGEVWICSGQSNMAFFLKDAATAKEDLLAADSCRDIRLFHMKPRWETNNVNWNLSALDSIDREMYYQPTQWEIGNRKSAESFSAIAWHFGKMLSDSLKVPIGLIVNAVGGSPCESWIDKEYLEKEMPEILVDWYSNELVQDWVRERAATNVALSDNEEQKHPYHPGYLFETGIRSLNAYPVRGVIWYQGESNAHNVEAHEILFPLLIKNWREYWNKENLPFYYVQLSSINRPSWPGFRDSQRELAARIPHTGMVVSSDKGHPTDVHPKKKREIGERLAFQALNNTYCRTEITPSGPLFHSMELKDGKVYLYFEYGDGMCSSDGAPLRTFELAGADTVFFPVRAEPLGNRILLHPNTVDSPRFVRYAWQPFSEGNLINKDSLPASTFWGELNTGAEQNCHCGLDPQSPLPSYPVKKGISAPFCGVYQEHLIVAGGSNFPSVPASEGGTKEYLDEIYVLNLQEPDQWKGPFRFPFPVAYGASVNTAAGIVCIGGMNKESSLSEVVLMQWNDFAQSIDFIEWPALPESVDNAAATELDGIIYLLGGNVNGKPTPALFTLDTRKPDAGWERLPPFPGAARVQPAVVASGNKLFLAGGYQPASREIPPSISENLLEYNPQTKEWIEKSTIPIGEKTFGFVGGSALSNLPGSILFLGGVHPDRFLAALEREAALQKARTEKDDDRIKQLEMDGRNYLLHDKDWYKFNQNLLQYDPVNDQWQTIISHPALARAGAGITHTENCIFIIGGELKPGIRMNHCFMLRK